MNNSAKRQRGLLHTVVPKAIHEQVMLTKREKHQSEWEYLVGGKL